MLARPMLVVVLVVAVVLVLGGGASAATLTWTGGGDGYSWNGSGNWTGGTRPGTHDTLNITTTATIDNVYRNDGTATYDGGSTWRGTVHLNQGTVLLDHRFESGEGAFYIGDGAGTADAIVNVPSGGYWMFDRHSNGTYNVYIDTDGQLNATGTGYFAPYGGHGGRQWEINVQGGSITSQAGWNMSDGPGYDANRLNLSNGGTVDVGAITVHEEIIDFADLAAGNQFTAGYGGSFTNIGAVNAALGSTFTASGGGVLQATDNVSNFTVALLFASGDRTWNSPTTGDWSSLANWDDGPPPPSGTPAATRPTATENAFIPAGTVNVTGAENAFSLDVGSTLPTGNPVLDVNSGGSLTVAGGTTVGSTGTLDIRGALVTGNITSSAGSAVNLHNGGALTTKSGTIDTLNVSGAAALNGGGNLTVSNAVLNGATFTVNQSAGTATVRNISETAGSGITKEGSGTLLLDTGNTYTGATTINGGIVSVRNGGGLGSGAGGTIVNDGGQLQLWGGITVNEAITINGQGPGNNGALYVQQGGTKTIAGLLQTGSNSRIHVDDPGSPRLRLTGGFALNHNVTVAADGTGERLEISSPMTGTGELRKEGNGRIEARTASPGYSGPVRITNGYVEAWTDNALGTGQIIAEGDGTLLLRNGATLPNNIRISTDGEGTAGAIRNENNTNTLTGTVTSVNNASRIHVNSGQLNLTNTLTLQNHVNVHGGGTLHVTGQVTGSGALNKNDAGRTILANAANNFTGGLNINGGVVSVASEGALGAAAGSVAVGGTGTLELDGAFNLAKPLSIAGPGAGGVGAVNSINANRTITSAIHLTGSAAIGSGTAGNTLTIDGPITMPLLADLTFTGDGDIVVNSPFGNGGPGFHNALRMTGYMNGGRQDADLNFDPTGSSGGGLLADTPVGTTAFTASLDINGDAAFRALIPGITRNDDYQTAFQGQFHALVDGDYTFQTTNKDDRTVIWLDVNKSGSFDNSGFSTPGEEQLVGLNNGTGTVSLTAGTYDIALGHMEHGGGSRIRALVQTPAGAGPTSLTVINPGDTTSPATGGQSGLFTTLATGGVLKEGTGTTTLAGANTYNGMTSIQEGTLVAAHSSALGAADGTAATGTILNGGATLVLQGGIHVGNEQITAGSNSGTMTLTSQGGSNSIGGGIEMGTSNLTVGGGGDLVISGAITGTNLSTGTSIPGLNFGRVSGNINTVDYPTSPTIELGPHVATTRAAADWPDNQTNTYWGQIYLDGSKSYNFIESIDDKTWLKIDDTVYINDGSWSNTTKSGLINKPTGWYDFELRMSDGGGGQGYVNINPGFQYNDTGIDNTNDADHGYPEDPGDASFFRIFSPLTPNDLLKVGPATVTLAGDNTYVGTTTVQEGTLRITGTTSGQGSYTVQSGATLGGTGTIGLAAGAAVTFANGSFLDPGTSPGTLTVDGDLVMETGSTYLWELGPTGHDLVDLTGSLALGDWTLALVDDGAEPVFGEKYYLFTSFSTLDLAGGSNPANFNALIDTSRAPDWNPAYLSLGLDDAGLYLSAIPEPGTLLLLAAGLLGLLAAPRRKRR